MTSLNSPGFSGVTVYPMEARVTTSCDNYQVFLPRDKASKSPILKGEAPRYANFPTFLLSPPLSDFLRVMSAVPVQYVIKRMVEQRYCSTHS
jgi:hypothetical protein